MMVNDDFHDFFCFSKSICGDDERIESKEEERKEKAATVFVSVSLPPPLILPH
jgi:hypothetical protein